MIPKALMAVSSVTKPPFGVAFFGYINRLTAAGIYFDREA